MTPGEYLHRRRAARGMTAAQVDAAVASLGGILSAPMIFLEFDLAPIGVGDAWALSEVIDFDIAAIGALAAGVDVGICRICGCSEDDPCIDDDCRGCSWTDEADPLCTACRPAAQAIAILPRVTLVA